jgi:hypothetical protein
MHTYAGLHRAFVAALQQAAGWIALLLSAAQNACSFAAQVG